MVNIGYRAARMQGKLVRSLYKTALRWIVNLPMSPTQHVPVRVYSFSCDRDLPEQVASIRSFIRYIGIPNKFTVISDGTYSAASRELLNQIDPCVEVVDLASMIKKDLPDCVYAYAKQHPLGKKLAVLISLPIDQVTVYADSDILFFPGTKELLDIVRSPDPRPRYLLDCDPALDARLLNADVEKFKPVNSGFTILKKQLNWEIALKKLSELNEPPNYFTEQTTWHLTMHYNQGMPLSPEQFVVSRDDEFIYQDRHCSAAVALRHYVSPIRHKFWFHGVI